MRALLDVNALVALIDDEHDLHASILEWLVHPSNVPHGFASCAITQVGVIRVLSSKGYFKPFEAHDVALRLRAITNKGHRYLEIPPPCDSLVRWKAARSLASTDATLLSTAVAHGCRLVTFDAGIALHLVAGAKREHLVLLRAA